MATTLKTAAESYLRAKSLSRGTRKEYLLDPQEVGTVGRRRPDRGTAAEGRPRVPGLGLRARRRRVRGEPRPHGEQGPRAPPRRAFVGLGAGTDRHVAAVPEPSEQRDVAGRHYLTKAEINALYFATHKMRRPRGWDVRHPGRPLLARRPGRVLQLRRRHRDRLEVPPSHEPILWRHVSGIGTRRTARPRSDRDGAGCSTP